jgi:thiol-disulfide isomerase/thioredoxin
MRLLLLLLLFQNLAYGQARSSDNINIDSFFAARRTAPLNHPFPQFAAANDSAIINNQSLAGKVVLVNFWFEGCHPCMVEMEALNELYQKLRSNKDFLFISFSWDNLQTIARVKNDHKVIFPVFPISDTTCMRLMYGNGYPTTMVLDKTGIVRFVHLGGSTKIEEAHQFIMDELLEEIKTLLK